MARPTEKRPKKKRGPKGPRKSDRQKEFEALRLWAEKDIAWRQHKAAGRKGAFDRAMETLASEHGAGKRDPVEAIRKKLSRGNRAMRPEIRKQLAELRKRMALVPWVITEPITPTVVARKKRGRPPGQRPRQ